MEKIGYVPCPSMSIHVHPCPSMSCMLFLLFLTIYAMQHLQHPHTWNQTRCAERSCSDSLTVASLSVAYNALKVFNHIIHWYYADWICILTVRNVIRYPFMSMVPLTSNMLFSFAIDPPWWTMRNKYTQVKAVLRSGFVGFLRMIPNAETTSSIQVKLSLRSLVSVQP